MLAVIVTVPNCDGVMYVTLAWPLALVTTDELDRVPFAPLSVKPTETPEIRFPYLSFTLTTKG